MFSQLFVISTICIYMALLFALAQWAERKAYHKQESYLQPWVYALSIAAVYFTAWGFYADAGIAASSGLIFISFNLGASLMILLWWWFLRRIVQLKSCAGAYAHCHRQGNRHPSSLRQATYQDHADTLIGED